jgi:hypothetical protein
VLFQEFEYVRHGTVNLLMLLAVHSGQAVFLLGAVGRGYLKRASCSSRENFLRHVRESWPEYNRLCAHPFEWYGPTTGCVNGSPNMLPSSETGVSCIMSCQNY